MSGGSDLLKMLSICFESMTSSFHADAISEMFNTHTKIYRTGHVDRFSIPFSTSNVKLLYTC